MCMHLKVEQNLISLNEAKGRRLLHLNTTGSLVNKLQDLSTQKEKILYNAVVFCYKKKDQLYLPVTEIVSWSHDILAVSWLNRFIHDCGQSETTKKGNNGFCGSYRLFVGTDSFWH